MLSMGKTKKQQDIDKEIFDKVLIAHYIKPGDDNGKYIAYGFADKTLDKMDDETLDKYKDEAVKSIDNCYEEGIDTNSITFIFTKDLDVLVGTKDDITIEFLKENG